MHIKKLILLVNLLLLAACAQEENPENYSITGTWVHKNGSLTRKLSFNYPSFSENYTNTGINPITKGGTYEKDNNTLYLKYTGILDENLEEYAYRIDNNVLILTHKDSDNNNLAIHTSFHRE